jgi:hypothetical protein
MDEAVLALLSEQLGGFVTSFYLIATFVDDEGGNQVTWEVAPDQTLTQTLGLIHWARSGAERELHDHLNESQED